MDNFNFSESTSSWHASQCFTIALSKLYKETGLIAKVSFAFDPNQENQIIIDLSLNRDPTEKELQTFANIIINTDLLLTNYNMINFISNHDDINTLMFKLQEETKQLSHQSKLSFTK